jgi:chromosome segregation ATPase
MAIGNIEKALSELKDELERIQPSTNQLNDAENRIKDLAAKTSENQEKLAELTAKLTELTQSIQNLSELDLHQQFLRIAEPFNEMVDHMKTTGKKDQEEAEANAERLHNLNQLVINTQSQIERLHSQMVDHMKTTGEKDQEEAEANAERLHNLNQLVINTQSQIERLHSQWDKEVEELRQDLSKGRKKNTLNTTLIGLTLTAVVISIVTQFIK